MTASTCPLALAHRSMPWRMVRCIAPGRRIKRRQGFGSTHVILKVCDPTDGQHDLFLVYLHLDSIADGVIPGVPVHQGDVIGAVGQEDATYPHLHFEFRKGGPKNGAVFTRYTICPTSIRRTLGSSVWIAAIFTATTMARNGS